MPKPLGNHTPFEEVEEEKLNRLFLEAEALRKKYRSWRGTAPIYTHTHTCTHRSTTRRILWNEVGMEREKRSEGLASRGGCVYCWAAAEEAGALQRRAVSLHSGLREPSRQIPVSEHGTKPQRVTQQKRT